MNKLYLILLLTFLSNLGYSQSVPVACYPFNGNALDYSGNGFDCIVNGAVLVPDRLGNPASAYHFDGIDDYIQTNVVLDSILLSDELTISFWAQVQLFKTNSPILLVPDNPSDRLNIHIHYDNSGDDYTFLDYGSISSGGRLSFQDSFETSWDHYAFVISALNDSMFIYKNGVLKAYKSNIDLLVDKNKFLNIGGGMSGAINCFFSGEMDDIRIYNNALTASEIVDEYNNTLSCNEINIIEGKIVLDLNSNMIHDIGETTVSNILIQETTTGKMVASNILGEYKLGVNDTGNYAVSSIAPGFFNSVPASYPVYFNALSQTDSLNDFYLQPTGILNDLHITISPLTAFRPGFYASYNVTYNNVGTTVLTPTIIMFLDTSLAYDTSSIIPTTITSDSITWALPLLSPFGGGSFTVTCVVNPATPIGTLIDTEVRIEPIAGDSTASDNTASWQIPTTGSYDPNDILVNRSFIETPELISPPFLNYIIRFQNTGNDTAFNIHIQNQIPIELLETSFELIDASHPVGVNYNAGNRTFTFSFSQVLLPDSNTNEPASHGFVEYRIKPLSTLSAGQSIINNAGIYFDFNAPVLTNDAVTNIISPTSVNAISTDDLKVKLYPVPASNMLSINIQDSKSKLVSYQMVDITGKSISSEKFIVVNAGSGFVNENISFLERGFYLIKFRTDSGYKVLPFLKQ